MHKRKIIHLDMDCFYAAVEIRERSALASLPVAVGGGERRGVVCTCNYVARKYGVRSAMSGFMAREKCPSLIFLAPRFDLYREESQKIRRILNSYTELVEPLSLDEAYMDVSDSRHYAWDLAKEIRGRIWKELRLTASAGIAPNKMLAKIASDWKKPNGQFAVLPEQIADFMKDLPIRKIPGVGPKSTQKFIESGIHTCGDLQKLSLSEMVRRYHRWGVELFHLCRGRDDREVNPHRVRKSLSNELTYDEDLHHLEDCERALQLLAEELLEEVRRKAGDRRVKKAFIKICYSDFTKTTKECVCREPTPEIFVDLLRQAYGRRDLPVRLLGTGIRFAEEEEYVHPELWENLPG